MARAAVLKRMDALRLPTIDQLLTAPQLGIEWHYDVRELCRLLSRVADVPLMSINLGVGEPAAYRHIAFKGGSDAGVINLTTIVPTQRGAKLCFSATLNDPMRQVDESAFTTAYSSVLRVLASS